MPSGLLAGKSACCYRLDYKQLIYLFDLQWRLPEMETLSPTRTEDENGFRGFPKTSQWLWPDDCAHPVSASRSSLVASVLRLAELRSLSRISRVATFPDVLDGEARGAIAFSARGPLQADQAGRAQGHRRRIQIALSSRVIAILNGRAKAQQPINCVMAGPVPAIHVFIISSVSRLDV